MPPRKTLLFVYNADSGVLNAIKDGIEKIASPTKYPCRLCGLTYGITTMKPKWRRFISSLGVSIKFLHKDEFHDIFSDEYSLPAVFFEKEGKLEILISKEEMNSLGTLEELMSHVQARVKKAGLA